MIYMYYVTIHYDDSQLFDKKKKQSNIDFD